MVEVTHELQVVVYADCWDLTGEDIQNLVREIEDLCEHPADVVTTICPAHAGVEARIHSDDWPRVRDYLARTYNKED